MKGADVKADTINADVKGKLAIESVQDTVTQHSEQSNVGARVQVSFGTAWEASGSFSKASGDSSATYVNEQSGLFAGNGGYHVKADTVDLKGGAITSTNAANSALTTNALTFSNLENKMNYKAGSMSLAGSISGGSGAGDKNADGSKKPEAQQQTFGSAKSGNVTPGLPMQEKGGAHSTTYATLTDGAITIGGKTADSAEDLGINTDAGKAHNTIAAAPDIKAVMKEQQAMSAAAGTVIATSKQVANDIAAKAAKTQLAAQEILNNPNSSDEEKAQANQAIIDSKQAQKDWGVGGKYSLALAVGTGLVVDGVASGKAGAATANAVGAVLDKQIGDIALGKWEDGSPEKTILHGLAGVIQAGIGGTDALAGATAGAAKEALTPAMESFLTSQGYKYGTAEFNDMMKLGSVLVGAAAGAVVGGNGQNITAGANIALNAETYNRQLHPNERKLIERLAKEKAQQQCRGDAQCETKAILKWTDAMERVAESMTDDKEYAKNAAYLNTLVKVSADPNSEGARGALEAYLADLQTARDMLAPYQGKTITVNGVAQVSYGAEQTYFNATAEQRADPHVNEFLFPGQKPDSIAPLMGLRDEDRIERFGARNGSTKPIYPVEEVLLTGAVGNRLAGAVGRWLASLDVEGGAVIAGQAVKGGSATVEKGVVRIQGTKDVTRLDYSSTLAGDLRNFNPGYTQFSGVLDNELMLVQFHRSDRALGQGRSAAWWTTPEQANQFFTIGDVRQGLALPPGWGPRDAVSIARIPKGTEVEFFHGTALKQTEGNVLFNGNGVQYRFKNFDPNWIVETRKIPEGK